ncbi:MAG: tRNA pseudouridine(13) synthase TruD [Deltaproteobacteria bacterium]|nr:tRNA pseudouridine(13) synthase TruD [Deltaproteobacteria bacterium]MBT8465222.1 tRNA pseudouridine(13) synthase TruD [Deltaproteobacteria bacterium]NND30145.1 tRNA pseudouridine(13) synthase TruD [Myxococcales bacterium]NNK08945.1 tRNA pseudouridine(13) synthase TruD [Myxococcales bacterium]NNK41274.1 tRNA pseudouridine(13) synthase TruD [Myxococcales bacterium]
MMLPYLTRSFAPFEADFRTTPEDFEVEEIAAYRATGTGEHAFAFIEKRGLTTKDAVRALCERVGADPDAAGWAGLKDRHAVTRQWISLFGASPDALLQADLDGVRVLEATLHPQKLRTGHLRANRFRIRLRQFERSRIEELRRLLAEIEQQGLPNYYGEQRFGRDGNNAQRALRWVRGEARAPRARFQRKLQMSALQSQIFNRCVAERVQSSTLGKVYPGDLVKKHESGGLFVAPDVEGTQVRADAWEISSTGPIFGAKMRWPEGDARQREEALLEESGLTLDRLAKWKRVAPGTRRFVRVPVSNLELTVSDHTVVLDFTLPAGSYATIVIREILKRDAQPPKTG